MQGGTTPRPYLRAEERRAQLLDAAATVVGREGLGGLTVAAVAGQAAVSRQWVYEHFADLDDLWHALLLDRFAALDARLDAAAHECADPLERALAAARLLFAQGPADRRILWALVDGSGGGGPELLRVQRDLRERILRRWTGVVRALGYDEGEARAVVWAVVHVVFALADQIEREGLETEGAVRLLRRMVAAVTTAPSPGPGPRRRPERPARPPTASDPRRSAHAH